MSPAVPDLSVVVPSRGDPAKLRNLFDALDRQTLARDRYEVILALDRAELPPDLAARAETAGYRAVRRPERSGPGAARNRGAADARGAFLAFTEDDVTPAPDWLERALARIAADPALDVLEGATLKPGGRPVRIRAEEGASWLPTNLFVRRALFVRVGGYCERFFDGERGIYFREDSDFGFTLEAAGAGIAHADDVRVEHPDEHPGFLDPLRWARRYEMDALLAARHPRRFRERIEVHRLGPFRIRRPIVRAASAYVLALSVAAIAAALGSPDLAGGALLLAALAFLPVWAKWRFSPLRLPVALLVPFALVLALARGRGRVRTGERAVEG